MALSFKFAIKAALPSNSDLECVRLRFNSNVFLLKRRTKKFRTLVGKFYFMEKRSKKLAFQISKEELQRATQELIWEIYKDRLSRDPLTEDNPHFQNNFNPNNSAIQDMYYDGVKYGELATTSYFDGPGYLELTFTPVEV